jgi:uncharacterized protein YaaN involved in tellurite resistance
LHSKRRLPSKLSLKKRKHRSSKRKSKFLTEQVGVKEAVSRALHSMTGLEKKEEDPVEHQVEKLAEAIQQLQQRIIDLELRTVPSTP